MYTKCNTTMDNLQFTVYSLQFTTLSCDGTINYAGSYGKLTGFVCSSAFEVKCCLDTDRDRKSFDFDDRLLHFDNGVKSCMQKSMAHVQRLNIHWEVCVQSFDMREFDTGIGYRYRYRYRIDTGIKYDRKVPDSAVTDSFKIYNFFTGIKRPRSHGCTVAQQWHSVLRTKPVNFP